MDGEKMKMSRNAELVALEISIKSLLCLYYTSSPNGVTHMLLKRKSELHSFFKSDFDNRDLIEILRLLVNVYNLPSDFTTHKSEILSTTHSEEFIESIKQYLLGVKTIQKNRTKLLEEINYIVWFIDVNVNELPVSNIYYNRFWSLLKTLHETLTNCGFKNEAVVFWTHELTALVEKKLIHINRINLIWKDMSIYPDPVDFFEHKDLTGNKTFGPYKYVSEYLDIQFKLFKEDFESNLREGLLQYKAEQRGAPAKENTEIYIHNQVIVESLEIDKNARNGVLHKIILTQEEKALSNDISKPFLNGTLLVFSEYSQFTTFILATVVEVMELKENQRNLSKALTVSVIGDPSLLLKSHKYTVAEPKTFFEPYHQVLKSIQLLEQVNLPMVKYIVHTDSTPNFPNYVHPHSVYNVAGRKLQLFCKEKWPCELLKLNPEQMEALHAALNHEFILIQGPPGTGKTLLAQNIIKILLESCVLSTPILLISSKNDPVDQILEPLAIAGRKVVRLGGQSKSAVLKKCSIFNVGKITGEREFKDRVNNMKEDLKKKMDANLTTEEEIKSFQLEQKSFIEFCNKGDANLILSRKVEVVGGTTAGCARLRLMLDNLQPEVVIVENANEILELHIVASIPKGCKHLILLGDVEQLQPNLSSNNSSEMYNLDVSLFKRMANCGMKCCTLNEQRRMKPEIASLLCPAVYSNMTSHSALNNLPDIKGMKKNLFFLDHKVKDSQVSQSYSNKHEADMMLALAEYLIKQGYSNSDITILSPYTAQQNYMKQAARNISYLQNVEIQMIDNYSGQENMIILLSLVRSNSPAIGFLSSNNRINVALSRAKCGLYIIGNMNTLISGSKLWSSLNEVLKQQGAIGNSIELICQNHKTVSSVTNKEDFKKIYDGVCKLPCKAELKCGHFCKLLCHQLVEKHNTYNCKEPCPKYCIRSLHKCKKKCQEKCGSCKELCAMELPCGHITAIPCSNVNSNYICTVPTQVDFLCFFPMTVPCYEADSSFFYCRK